MKYISITLKFLLSTLILFIFFAVWSVYTQSGRDFLAYLLNNVTISKSVTIQVSKIHSILPLYAELSSLALLEDEEPWVKLEDAEVNADVIEYLKGKEVLFKVSIGQLLIKNIQTEDASTAASSEPPFDKDFNLKIALDLNIETVIAEGYTGDKSILIKDVHIDAEYSKNFDLKLRGSLNDFGEPLFIKGQAFGSLNSFQANFSLNSNHVKYQNYFVNHLRISGKFNGLPMQPTGVLSFEGNPMRLGNIKGEVGVTHLNKDIHIDLQKLDSEFLEANGSAKFDTSTNDIRLRIKGDLKQHTVPKMYSIQEGRFDVMFEHINEVLSGLAEVRIKSFDGFDSRIEELSLDANMRDFSLNGAGKINLKANGLEGFGLQFDTFSFGGKLADGKADFNMNASGPEINAVLSGDLQQKDKTQTLTIQKGEVLYNKVKLGLSNPTQISIHDDRVTVPMARFHIGGGNLSLSGMADDSSVDVKINLKLPLEPFASLFLPPEHFLKGDLNSDISIKGALESPLILGRVSLTEGLYENIEYGVYINDIESQLNTTGTRVDIASFNAKSHNEGDIRVSGFIDLKTDTVDVNVTSGPLKLLDSELIEATFKEISLKLAGSLNDLMCSGNILFEKGKLDIGINQPQKIKLLKECDNSKNSPKNKEQTEALPLSILLNIDIESQPQFKVYGRGLDSIWGGNLKIKGNASEPLLAGEIKLERGSFKLLGTDLELEEGNIVFSGAPENIPYIKVVTTTQNANYKIKVLIQGTPESISFDFSSTPSLPRDEIISQILFGKLSEDLTAFEAIQLARSIATLTGGGSSTDIMGEISDALGVDLISVDVDQEKSSASIHIEKRLNDRVKFFTDQSSDIEESSAGVEVKLTDNITLKTEHGLIIPDENISINYQLDY